MSWKGNVILIIFCLILAFIIVQSEILEFITAVFCFTFALGIKVFGGSM